MNEKTVTIHDQMLEQIRFEYREYRRERDFLYEEARVLLHTTKDCDYIERAELKLNSAVVAADAMRLLHRLHRKLEGMTTNPFMLDMETGKPIGEDE